MTPRELFYAYYRAMNARDLDAMSRLVHPDFVEDYPQSGERIRGPQNIRAIVENYPGGVSVAVDAPKFFGAEDEWVVAPSFLVIRVTAQGDTGTGVLKLRYPDESEWWMVVLFELKDGLLYRQQTFFAEPFEAPEWRAQWVERTPESD